MATQYDVNYTMKVNEVAPVIIRNGPGTEYDRIGTLAVGTTIAVDKIAGNWYHHSTGWSCVIDTNYNKVLILLSDGNTVTAAGLASGTTIPKTSTQNTIASFVSATTLADAARFKELRGVHGMPYHFLDSTDIYLSNLSSTVKDFYYGRKFTERILTKMPLLILTPGAPSFLEGYNKAEKEDFIAGIFDATFAGDSQLDKILDADKGGKYYTFKMQYAEYYKYVNGMCWASAKFLGIHNNPIFSTDGVTQMVSGSNKGYTYAGANTGYDWSNYPSDSLKGFFSGKEYVAFYIESESQVSESFSNSTKESMIDSGLNALSDLGKEADFLLGAGMGVKLDAMNADNYKSNMESINDLLTPGFNDPKLIVERLSEGIVTVSSGGQLIFPEIWSDSSFSKSYDITIKLISPDGDDESIYLNILVPLYHLMGLVVPMQMGTNGYRTPFLVRGYYRGIFNVDMGIITSMSIRKGADSAWNINGLPTEVEVSLNIKDLYEILTMTKYTDSDMFVNNTPMLDFLATMSGISINKPELFRKAEMWATLRYRTVKDWPSNKWNSFQQGVSNFLQGTLK